MISPTVELKLLDPRFGRGEFPLPAFATDGAAGLDLRAAVDAPLTLDADACVMIPTGLAIHLADRHWAALILPRSGLGHKGLILGNTVGLIDADYQGEIRLSCWNRGRVPLTIEPGDRVAQMVVIPIVTPVFRVVTAFAAETTRRDGGFGHSGLR